MNIPETEKSREGKYCPRCRIMTFRDREVCEHCGHQFRTGLGTGLGATQTDAVITDEAALNRTMQFTLPPLAPRAAPAEADPVTVALPPAPRLGRGRLASAALALIVLVLGYSLYAHTAHAAKPSPAGVWETAPTGRAPQGAHLRLALGADGGGSFSWEAGGSAPPRPTPLRWHLDPDGNLVLSIAPAPSDAADPIPGSLITVLDSRPWLWRVDRPRHQLTLGALSFTEKT